MNARVTSQVPHDYWNELLEGLKGNKIHLSKDSFLKLHADKVDVPLTVVLCFREKIVHIDGPVFHLINPRTVIFSTEEN